MMFHDRLTVKDVGLTIVPSEIALHLIFPFLPRSSQSSFCNTSRHYRNLFLSSDATQYWNRSPFKFCIDSYCCPVCPLKSGGSIPGALSILSNYPFENIIMHGFVTDISDCLIALSSKGTVRSLHLTVTNKACSPPLCDSLPTTVTGDMLPHLTELILDSAHLHHINPAGRYRLLSIIGTRLKTLSFVGGSCSRTFEMVNELCPNLKTLRVDKASSIEDLAAYHSDSLENIELCRANFLLTVSLQLPRLKKLKFTSNSLYERGQFVQMITGLSLNHYLVEIDLEVPSDIASSLLPSIASALPRLRYLKLEGSYVCGGLERTGLTRLRENCLQLQSLELFSTRSVTTLGFQKDSFHLLGSFPALQKIRVKYEDTVIDELNTVLSGSKTLQHVILWENKRWSAVPWAKMLKRIRKVSKGFPSIKISLEDVAH
mmetsp:Transcript_33705/g.34333  ORF Transcript_33705/g.34333 Transcript_33705/m.34333 type:complete len:430 (-) Transcript_33705:292-1581(-)